MEQTNFIIGVLSGTTCAIKKYNGSETSIEIPSVIENDGKKYQVVEIAASAFKCKKIKSVSLPEGLTVINDDAFNGCDQLEEINFPSTLTEIKYNAFKGCFKLNGIVLPQSLTTIGEHCFEYCKALRSITLPASLKVVPEKAFLNCESLDQLTISDGVEEIKENAFYYCNFAELVIPNSVKKIGRKAFSSCLNLTNVFLSEELKSSLDASVFSGCKSVVFNTGVAPTPVAETKEEKTIEPVVEKTQNSVQKDSSDKCSGGSNADWMKEFVIEILDPKQKSCIIKKYKGKSATVVVPQEVEIEGSIYTVTAIGDKAFSESNKTCRIKEVHLPETITSIGKKAFEECREMEKINIPSGLTHIGTDAFSSCYPSVGCVLYDNGTKLYTYLSSGIFEDVKVPEGVVEIDPKAFYYKELGSVTLPSTLKKIGESAFESGGCSQINLPEGLEEIGKSAFSNCKMKKITIPAGVKVIREDTFRCCGNLERVVFSAGLKEIEESAFSFCDRLASVKLPKGVKVHKFAFNKTAISYVSEDDVDTKVEKNATIDTEDLYVILSPNNLPRSLGEPYVEEEFDEGKNIFLFHTYEGAREYMINHDFEDYNSCYLIGHLDPKDKCNLRSIFKNLLKMGVTHYLLDGKSLGSIETFINGVGGSEGVADLTVGENISGCVSSVSQLLSSLAGENPSEEDKNAIQEFQNMFNDIPSVHIPVMNFTYPFDISQKRCKELLEQVTKSKSLDELYDKMIGNTYFENCYMSFCLANGGMPEEVEGRYRKPQLISVCASAIWYTMVTNQARLFMLEDKSTGDTLVQPLHGTDQVMVVVAYSNLLRYLHPNLKFVEVQMADLSTIMEEHDDVAGILFADMQGISAFAGRPGWLSK